MAAPQILLETGFLKYVLPRFSLKTGLSVSIGSPANIMIDVALPDGRVTKLPPLMQGPKQVYYAWALGDDIAANRLIDWLYSEIGQRTIQAFRLNDEQLFFAVEHVENTEETLVLPGDIAMGETLAFGKCGRCHVIGDRNRMQGLGSTPSFGLLRTFDNWLERFEAFYALNPHPSFSQVEGITAPFDPLLPPPISPLVVTPQELQSITAYVATIAPADLGNPLVHQ